MTVGGVHWYFCEEACSPCLIFCEEACSPCLTRCPFFMTQQIGGYFSFGRLVVMTTRCFSAGVVLCEDPMTYVHLMILLCARHALVYCKWRYSWLHEKNTTCSTGTYSMETSCPYTREHRTVPAMINSVAQLSHHPITSYTKKLIATPAPLSLLSTPHLLQQFHDCLVRFAVFRDMAPFLSRRFFCMVSMLIG